MGSASQGRAEARMRLMPIFKRMVRSGYPVEQPVPRRLPLHPLSGCHKRLADLRLSITWHRPKVLLLS